MRFGGSLERLFYQHFVRQLFASLSRLLRWLCYQLFVRQPLADHPDNQRMNPVHRMDFHVPLVKPERKLIDISRQVFDAEMVKGAMIAALQERPNAFDSIRARHAVNIFSCPVRDYMVVVAAQIAISAMFIRTDRSATLDVPCDFGLQGLARSIRNRKSLDAMLAATLSHAHYSGFTNRAPASLELLVLVLVSFQPTNKGFVYLDDARQLFAFIVAALSDALK